MLTDLWKASKGRFLSAKTLQNYVYEINRHILPYFGERDVRFIKPYHIEWFVSQLLEQDYALSSIRYYAGRVSQILEFGYINEFIDRNPASKIKLPKAAKVQKEIIGDEVIDQINKQANPLVMLYLYTGLRRGEGLALMWDGICFTSREIQVTKTVSYVKNQATIKPPKSEAGIRTVPLVEPLHNLLYDLYCQRISKYAFPNHAGGMMSLTSFRTFWKNSVKDLGIKIKPHQLRHTYITMLYEAGIDVKTAQMWAGHSSVGITLEIYTHLRQSLRASQVGKRSLHLISKIKNPKKKPCCNPITTGPFSCMT